MTNNDLWKEVEEGKTKFITLNDAERIYDSSVFYNPRMVINRDFTLLMLETIGSLENRPLVYVDPLAGTGIRSFRILEELSPELIECIVISDKNPKAVEIIEKNAANLNRKDKIRIQRSDAFALMSQLMQEQIYPDVIDIDPFGSPANFIETSLRALRKNQGYLFATATDLQVLCGRYPEACYRIYNAHPTRHHLCHEVALRILLYNVLVSAGRLGLAIQPLISINHEHFLRIKLKVLESKDTANIQHIEQGFVHFCPRCSYYLVTKIKETFESNQCPKCETDMETAGPLWLGPLYDKEYISIMQEKLEELELPSQKQIEKILNLILEEEESPLFYFLPYVLRQINKKGVTRQQAIDGLRDAGFKASRTIFDPEGLKTDATYSDLVEIINKF
ncbi:MAG: tRNA (guanine(10)-N(2))-dimethyltransferase [Candidatus Heimdallarchaeota archaeon]|nr:tRNA (guanine(10)-N(2))-dimethyltransferase [Candidatus Heimdallarchaeota archaeon]